MGRRHVNPIHEIAREDGPREKGRLQDGHVYLCATGCCCGHTEKGLPAVPLNAFRKQWKARGIRRRFELTVSGCLGPCEMANVALVRFAGESVWLRSINNKR